MDLNTEASATEHGGCCRHKPLWCSRVRAEGTTPLAARSPCPQCWDKLPRPVARGGDKPWTRGVSSVLKLLVLALAPTTLGLLATRVCPPAHGWTLASGTALHRLRALPLPLPMLHLPCASDYPLAPVLRDQSRKAPATPLLSCPSSSPAFSPSLLNPSVFEGSPHGLCIL